MLISVILDVNHVGTNILHWTNMIQV